MSSEVFDHSNSRNLLTGVPRVLELYNRRGLENTIDHRKTDLSIPNYRTRLDSSKCSDIVCIEGRAPAISPPLSFVFYSSIIILIIFFSFLSSLRVSGCHMIASGYIPTMLES